MLGANASMAAAISEAPPRGTGGPLDAAELPTARPWPATLASSVTPGSCARGRGLGKELTRAEEPSSWPREGQYT
jgi:hypothetical protein